MWKQLQVVTYKIIQNLVPLGLRLLFLRLKKILKKLGIECFKFGAVVEVKYIMFHSCTVQLSDTCVDW